MLHFLQEDIPEGLRVQSISQGAVTLADSQDYEVKLIVVPAPERAAAEAIPQGEYLEGFLLFVANHC